MSARKTVEAPGIFVRVAVISEEVYFLPSDMLLKDLRNKPTKTHGYRLI